MSWTRPRFPLLATLFTLLSASTLLSAAGCGSGAGGDEADGRLAAIAPRGTAAVRSGDAVAGFEPIRLTDCAAFPPESLASWSSGSPGMFTTTGSPRGYLYTQKEYADFTLQLEFRYDRPESVREDAELDNRNTGVLVYVPADHRIWPRSPEVQGRHDELASVKSNAPDLQVTVLSDSEAMRQLARRPVGQWNRLTIISRGGALRTYLNGVKIAETLPCDVQRGHIGFQSEGFVVHFRNVQIRAE